MALIIERIDGLLHIYSDRQKMIQDSAGNVMEEALVRENANIPLNYSETDMDLPPHEEIDEEA